MQKAVVLIKRECGQRQRPTAPEGSGCEETRGEDGTYKPRTEVSSILPSQTSGDSTPLRP